MASACATCASIYGEHDSPATEKPLFPGRQLDCCGRSICVRCLNSNPRYNSYCPYCQISSEPTSLPQGLRDPPEYSSINIGHSHSAAERSGGNEEPPPYESKDWSLPAEKSDKDQALDVLHFVAPGDSMQSIALAYNIPIKALRATNHIYSDHLVQARRTILIPGEFYKAGVSLSPRPLEGEEEEARKHKLRRWMVICKVAEYDVAVLYLEQSDWNLDAAIETWREHEQWEKDHPLHETNGRIKGKSASKAAMRRFVGSTPGTRT